MKKPVYSTTYLNAVNWLHNHRILCNDIVELDETVIGNMRFTLDEGKEIFQWFLMDCTLDEVQFLEEHFGLLFTYSNLLDLYVLCVDHLVTAWDYVHCDTDIKNAEQKIS